MPAARTGCDQMIRLHKQRHNHCLPAKQWLAAQGCMEILLTAMLIAFVLLKEVIWSSLLCRYASDVLRSCFKHLKHTQIMTMCEGFAKGSLVCCCKCTVREQHVSMWQFIHTAGQHHTCTIMPVVRAHIYLHSHTGIQAHQI